MRSGLSFLSYLFAAVAGICLVGGVAVLAGNN